MPFGLMNAPSYLQERMDKIFNGRNDFLFVYIDDILIFSKDIDEHRSHLNIFYNLCLDSGIVLSLSKIQWCQDSCKFLGMIVKVGQLEVQPHIKNKILEFQPPLNTKELQGFLGILNYVNNFYPNVRF